MRGTFFFFLLDLEEKLLVADPEADRCVGLESEFQKKGKKKKKKKKKAPAPEGTTCSSDTNKILKKLSRKNGG